MIPEKVADLMSEPAESCFSRSFWETAAAPPQENWGRLPDSALYSYAEVEDNRVFTPFA